jgi:hypothetical protein
MTGWLSSGTLMQTISLSWRTVLFVFCLLQIPFFNSMKIMTFKNGRGFHHGGHLSAPTTADGTTHDKPNSHLAKFDESWWQQ